jgi:hypothetical protein
MNAQQHRDVLYAARLLQISKAHLTAAQPTMESSDLFALLEIAIGTPVLLPPGASLIV